MTEATHASVNGKDDDALAKRVAEGPRGGARTWYDVLEVPADASAGDLKKAYDRALALVEGRSIGGYLMLDPLAAESARADVEAAYAVLGDAERRRAYDEKLARSGEEPAARPSEKGSDKGEGAEKGAPADKGDDEEQRNAREMLAIDNAQKKKAPERTASSPALKFTAPAEPSEEAPASPGRPSSPPKGSVIKFEVPKTSPGSPAEEEPRRIAVAPPVDEAPMTPMATVLPQAAMPPPGSPPPGSSPPGSSPPAAPASAPQDALPEGGEVTGAVLRALREGRGLTLDDLAEATKIRKPYLRAIEEEDIPNLPARVYLRGFLTQIGRVLKVDRTRVAEGYLTNIEKKGAPGA